MAHKCEIFDQFAQPMLAVCTHSPVENLPIVLGEAYRTIIEYLAELDEQPGGSPYVAYHNLDVQDLEIEIGFPVSKSLPGTGDIQALEMPAGKYAACLHKGPYADMAPAYDALNRFMTKNGLQPGRIVYEFYLNSPVEVAPEELKTHIVFPISTA